MNIEKDFYDIFINKMDDDAKTYDSIYEIFDVFKFCGYEIYMVGGAVRDIIRGVIPNDIDFCTNANIGQMIQLFQENNITYHLTGIRYGTITVVINNNTFEITTYRVDGEYTDGRHPSTVRFTSNLSEDLARRDFTVNAMAMDADYNIIDEYNGYEDLQNRTIRCVGDANNRFKEDGLRILRAVRFSCKLNFGIEASTLQAMKDNINMLNNVAVERIKNELDKIFKTNKSVALVTQYKFVFDKIMQILEIDAKDYDPNSIYGMLYRADKSNVDYIVKYGCILHEFKLEVVAHFMNKLKMSNAEQEIIFTLHNWRDIEIPDDKYKRRYIVVCMDGICKELMMLLSYWTLYKDVNKLYLIKEFYDMISSNDGTPYTVKDLAVNGFDLQHIGLEDRQIGYVLSSILYRTIFDDIPNEKEAQLDWAKKFVRE